VYSLWGDCNLFLVLILIRFVFTVPIILVGPQLHLLLTVVLLVADYKPSEIAVLIGILLVIFTIVIIILIGAHRLSQILVLVLSRQFIRIIVILWNLHGFVANRRF